MQKEREREREREIGRREGKLKHRNIERTNISKEQNNNKECSKPWQYSFFQINVNQDICMQVSYLLNG